jgi:RNA polymerase sigma-70 factor (ECF subfamily)
MRLQNRNREVSLGTNPPETIDSRADMERLFRLHSEGLAGAVRGILGHNGDIAEVLQEAFLRAWKACTQGVIPRDPKAWLFVVALNTARDQRRRLRTRGPALSLEDVNTMEIKTSEVAPETRLQREEAVEAARSAIHELGDGLREVFLLRVSGELSFESIAESLAIPVGTAKTRMRRALIHLRRNLKAFDPRALKRREIT